MAEVTEARVYDGKETTKNTTIILCANDSCNWGNARYDKSRILKHHRKCKVKDPDEERVWVIHEDQKHMILPNKKEDFAEFVQRAMTRLRNHLCFQGVKIIRGFPKPLQAVFLGVEDEKLNATYIKNETYNLPFTDNMNQIFKDLWEEFDFLRSQSIAVSEPEVAASTAPSMSLDPIDFLNAPVEAESFVDPNAIVAPLSLSDNDAMLDALVEPLPQLPSANHIQEGVQLDKAQIERMLFDMRIELEESIGSIDAIKDLKKTVTEIENILIGQMTMKKIDELKRVAIP